MSSPIGCRSAEQLREDALAIWQAGVAAAGGERLVQEHVHVAGDVLLVGDEEIDLNKFERICVVGAGKAGAGMAAGLEAALGEEILRAKDLWGSVNVPADCVRELQRIQLHAARPAGVNEPTEEGVAGTRQMLRIVESATETDLVICLLSGGGSALMPMPIDGVSLADKQFVTRFLSGAGANIGQLNTVRKRLSRVKGGGLARASRAGLLVTLIISDVIGDPLDVIASGPTVTDTATAEEALAILEHFRAAEAGLPASIYDALHRQQLDETRGGDDLGDDHRVIHQVIGNNAIAVDAAGIEAECRGYSHAMHAATTLEGQAEDIGRHLAKMALRMRDQRGPDCLITGGEPVVQLVDEARRGRGGRNQQLVLAAAIDILSADAQASRPPCEGICLLSGGTDGEDGPTDAAGALFDATVAASVFDSTVGPNDYLQRNDAYHFFEPLDALLKTGPTHTNVCDVRVVVVDHD